MGNRYQRNLQSGGSLNESQRTLTTTAPPAHGKHSREDILSGYEGYAHSWTASARPGSITQSVSSHTRPLSDILGMGWVWTVRLTGQVAYSFGLSPSRLRAGAPVLTNIAIAPSPAMPCSAALIIEPHVSLIPFPQLRTKNPPAHTLPSEAAVEGPQSILLIICAP
jgi:hypothetical protein